jgi:hypothetical protein
MIHPDTRRPAGISLLACVLVVSLLIVFVLSVVSISIINKGLLGHYWDNVTAQQAARAGIAESLYKLSLDPGWRTGFEHKTLLASGASYTVTFNSSRTDLPWSVVNTSSSTVQGWNGQQVPPSFAHLVSTGEFRTARVKEEAIVQCGAAMNVPGAVAITEFGNMSGGAMFDGWDSSRGTYEATATTTGSDLVLSVGTAGAVNMSGGAVIYGKARVGPGGSAATINTSGGAHYTEGLEAASTAPAYSVPSRPTGTSRGSVSMSNTTRALPPGIYGSLNSANSTLQLSKGDYVFSSMSMSRTEVQIVGPGPVRVFFTGAVNASGQTTFNMAGGKPSDLQFITDTGSAVSLSGHAAGYFLLYAPESTLSITGQSEIYGATVLRGINISGGAEIHFDKNLRVEFSGASGQRVIFRGE